MITITITGTPGPKALLAGRLTEFLEKQKIGVHVVGDIVTPSQVDLINHVPTVTIVTVAPAA